MELKNRIANRFRCHIDPQIGRPKNAFCKTDPELKDAHFELTPIGVYVRLKVRQDGTTWREEEHIVPYANIQYIRLNPLDKNTQ